MAKSAAYFLSVLVGFSSGVVAAAGIFAFIAVIGIVPRIAQKTKTQKHIPLYEDAITLGGVWGSTALFIDYSIPVGSVFAAVYAFATGVFFGCLAVSLAEVLNVMPIFARRIRIRQGISIFIMGVAFGKLVGSLFYFYLLKK